MLRLPSLPTTLAVSTLATKLAVKFYVYGFEPFEKLSAKLTPKLASQRLFLKYFFLLRSLLLILFLRLFTASSSQGHQSSLPFGTLHYLRLLPSRLLHTKQEQHVNAHRVPRRGK